MLVLGSSHVSHIAIPGAVTLSISGATVNQVHSSLFQQLTDRPDLSTVAIHVGTNDIKFRQSESLREDFRSLICTIRAVQPPILPIISGPFVSPRHNDQQFTRIRQLHIWLMGYCCRLSIPYVDNFSLFLDRGDAFAWDGRLGGDRLHLNRTGAGMLSRAIALTALSQARSRGEADKAVDKVKDVTVS